MGSSDLIPTALAEDLRNFSFVCGADEVGLGAWAGPLVVCAAIMPTNWKMPGVTDSKKMTPTARERLYPLLVTSVPHAIVEISSQDIDRIGVGKAWEEAHAQAIQKALSAHAALERSAPLVILDGSRNVKGAVSLPKADFLIPAVSAASIIAKVYRDHLMQKLDSQYPGYGFKSHVGYGTKQHREAIERLGVCPLHRMSYSPMSDFATRP